MYLLNAGVLRVDEKMRKNKWRIADLIHAKVSVLTVCVSCIDREHHFS